MYEAVSYYGMRGLKLLVFEAFFFLAGVPSYLSPELQEGTFVQVCELKTYCYEALRHTAMRP